MSETELQIALEKHYKRFEYGEWWIEEFNDDYVYIATHKYNLVTDVECTWIAKYVKKLLSKNNVDLNLIFVGPFFWHFKEVQ